MTDITLRRYARRPLLVDAVRVTEENIDDVAQWCSGNIKATPHPKTPGKTKLCIQVPVLNPFNKRQELAFIGDWVLLDVETGKSFKVFTNQAFLKGFDEIEGPVNE